MHSDDIGQGQDQEIRNISIELSLTIIMVMKKNYKKNGVPLLANWKKLSKTFKDNIYDIYMKEPYNKIHGIFNDREKKNYFLCYL